MEERLCSLPCASQGVVLVGVLIYGFVIQIHKKVEVSQIPFVSTRTLFSSVFDIVKKVDISTSTNPHYSIHHKPHMNPPTIDSRIKSMQWNLIRPLDQTNEKGETVLHIACQTGNQDLVKYIIRHTSRPSTLYIIQDQKGNTPLHYAIKKNYLTITQTLLNRSNPKLPANRANKTPFDYASQKLMFKDICLKMLSKNRYVAQTLPMHPDVVRTYVLLQDQGLQYAVKTANTQLIMDYSIDEPDLRPLTSNEDKIFTMLFKADFHIRADITQLVIPGRYPDTHAALQIYIRCGMIDDAIKEKMINNIVLGFKDYEDCLHPVQIMEILGLDPQTILIYAIRENSPHCVRYLCEKGLVLEKFYILQTNWGPKTRSYLLHAIQVESFEICQILLEHGANPNRKRTGTRLPLEEAIGRGMSNTCQLLLEHGADWSICNPQELDSLMILAIRHNQFNICQMGIGFNYANEYLFRVALGSRKIDFIKLFLPYASPNLIMKLYLEKRRFTGVDLEIKKLCQQHVRLCGQLLRNINKANGRKMSKWILRKISEYL